MGGERREVVLRVADEDLGALLRKLYSLLSAKADAEPGIQQTFGAVFRMIEHRRQLGSAHGAPR